jgi:hypothetical protein
MYGRSAYHKASTYTQDNTQNKRIPLVGFEPTDCLNITAVGHCEQPFMYLEYYNFGSHAADS